MLSKTFINERKNKIKCSVSKGSSNDLVMVKLEGPHSISTNEITIMESRIMSNMIKQYLSNINEEVPTNSTGSAIAGTNNDVTWKKIKSVIWNRKGKMKTFKEFVELTEAAKYENYDANSSAHNIVKQLNKERNPRKKLATYHKDGSATFHAHGAWHPYHSYHSYNVVDNVMKHAGGNFNHSPEVYDNHTQIIGGHVYHSKKVNNYQHDIHVKKV